MKPKDQHVPVNHRDAVMNFITQLRKTIPHQHHAFVEFLREMNQHAKRQKTRPTNFATHSLVIRWFVEQGRGDTKNAQHYHTLPLAYIHTIALHDTPPDASIDLLLYAGYLLF